MPSDLYQELILEHAKRPHGHGLRAPFHGAAHHVNPVCGDEIDIRVRLAGDVIADLSHDGAGCSISRAAASVLYDLVNGRTVDDALTRNDAFVALVGSGPAGDRPEPDEELLEDGVAFAGVARLPARVKCALLPWMAFKDALARAMADTPVVPDGSPPPAGANEGTQSHDVRTTMVGGPA